MNDRRLGDKWEDWNGKVENSQSSKWLFLLMSLVVVLFFSGIVLVVQYLIHPRLGTIYSGLPFLAKVFTVIMIVGMLTWALLFTISSITGVNILFSLNTQAWWLSWIMPYVSKVGARFGISRDKIGNSFIKVNNTFVMMKQRNLKSENIVILLPRCLLGDVREKINSIAAKYNIKTIVLAGGEIARQRMAELRPKAAIAVACERDLVSGIRDCSQVMVLGIPNKRPNGPCSNTVVDCNDVESAIKMLLGC